MSARDSIVTVVNGDPGTMPLVERRRTMTLLLAGVALFVMAQLAWWLYFQNAYVERVSRETARDWQRDASAATALLALGGDPDQLREAYPHLEFSAEGTASVAAERLDSFLNAQTRRIRMFVNESIGFAAVMLFVFWLLGRRFRVEQELKFQQQNFLSAVTHELKTPMSTMRLLVETVLDRELPAERQRDYLQRLEGELSRLEQLSEGVLASTRLEEQQLQPELQEAELNSLVLRIIDSHRPGFEARGARLEVVTFPEPLPVRVDRPSLELIIKNLIDNAIKYTPSAVKPVSIELEGRGDVVRLHVTDRGSGIPPAVGQRVFDRFYRVGSELQRTAPGVGLGLHLVKATAESLNGWVRHEAGPGGTGTRFTLSLPRSLSPATGGQQAAPDAPEPAGLQGRGLQP